MEGFPIVLGLGLGGEHLGLDHLQDQVNELLVLYGAVLFLLSLITSLFSQLNRADHPDIKLDHDDYGR